VLQKKVYYAKAAASKKAALGFTPLVGTLLLNSQITFFRS
jgi:hypothetical protein